MSPQSDPNNVVAIITIAETADSTFRKICNQWEIPLTKFSRHLRTFGGQTS